MASSGKKKSGKKNNWKAIPTERVIEASVKKSNWADEVESVYQDGTVNDHVPHKSVVLPTAPRASRATDIDESKIPHIGPFQIHVSNIPYELEEHELEEFFSGLQIKQVRLPKEEGKRAKGYGYVEFADRQSLIAALNKPDTVIKNRSIKIDLSTSDSGRGGMNRGGRGGNRDGGMRGGDMGDPDRTAGNWRSGPRSDYEERPSYDRGGGSGGSGFGGGGRRDFSSGSGSFRSGPGGFDREERSFRDDRDRGFGGGGFDRERGDRFQRDDRRRDDFDRGYKDDRSGFRDNRGGGGGGGFGRDRERGFDDDRREERGGGGGSWRDDSRGGTGGGSGGGSNKFEERRDRGEQRYAGPRRDEGQLPQERGGPPASTERRKLQLQPRSANLPAPEVKQPAVVSSAIFGGAKPVDTTAREREVEKRLARGEDVPERVRSGPGSTTSSKDYSESEREQRDRNVEPAPAPPPKENAWLRKPTSPMVNNGRTTPDAQSGTGDERGEGQKSWGLGEPRRQESRRTDDQRSSRPPPKTGPPSSGPDKGRARDDRPQNKSREPRKDHNVDDLSKMPKLVENEPPNFTGSNKYNPLDVDDLAE